MGTTHDEGNFNNGILQYFKKDRAALNEADYRGYLQRTYGGNAGAGGSPPAYAEGHDRQGAGALSGDESRRADGLGCRA